MRTVLALLFSFCISHAAAFGLAGAYERMLYWNAYQMDPEDGNDRTIGRGCKKTGRCNFAEFMAFIELTKSEGEVKNLLNGLNPINVDEGARMLDERGINKLYNSKRIANVGEPFQAFRVVGRSVGKWGNDPTKGNYRRALTARKRVHKLRVAEAHTGFCDTLREKFDKEHKKPKDRDGSEPYRTGLVQENNEERLPNGLRVLDCSVREAAERIRAAGNPDFSLNRLYKSWKNARKQGDTENDKDRHELNIQVIREARAWMLAEKC